MKILFLASGNNAGQISPIVKNQGESLKQLGLDVSYYTLEGKGIKGYIKNIPVLRAYLQKTNFDIIHAHYSLIGIVAALAGCKNLVVSLMGSDVFEFRWLRILNYIFYRWFWTLTIVKTRGMKEFNRLKKARVIPNGVDFDRFKPMDKNEIESKIALPEKPLVIFIGNPSKREKNISLAKEAMAKVKSAHIFQPLYGVANHSIPCYMNAASVLLMTSLWEGSPNVIKEAMACNLSIVTVNVGDVTDIIGDTPGCYICSTYNSDEIAELVEKALQFNKPTEGRQRIAHLSSDNIARQLHAIYQEVLT